MKSLKMGLVLGAVLISAITFAESGQGDTPIKGSEKVQKQFANPSMNVQRMNAMKQQKYGSKRPVQMQKGQQLLQQNQKIKLTGVEK